MLQTQIFEKWQIQSLGTYPLNLNSALSPSMPITLSCILFCTVLNRSYLHLLYIQTLSLLHRKNTSSAKTYNLFTLMHRMPSNILSIKPTDHINLPPACWEDPCDLLLTQPTQLNTKMRHIGSLRIYMHLWHHPRRAQSSRSSHFTITALPNCSN